MGTLLALAATTIAIGALYYGLPVARYRNKIQQGIEEAFRSQSFYETKEEINEKIPQNYYLSDDFHKLAMWWSELPASTRALLPQNVEAIFEDVTIKRGTPWHYNWFKSDGDKYAVLTIAVIVPLVCLWLIHWIPECHIEPFLPAYQWILLVGQLTVAAHMIGGSIMVKVQTELVRDLLSSFTARSSSASIRLSESIDPE